VPLAFNLAQNRNRTLHTSWGRYLQQDPNASGCSLVSNEAMNAGRTRTAVALMQIQLLYGNGANLYNYLGNRPMAGYDPLGLYFGQMATWDGGGRGYDPFDWVDDFIAEDAGSKAAFLNNVIGAARTTGYILGTIAQMHPAVGIAVAAYNIGSGQGSVWDVVAIVGGGGASLIGKTIGAAVRTEALTAGAVKIGSRLLGVTGHEWHHIIPRFLGGADDALQMLLPVEKHREFHAILRTKLKEIGLENAGNWSKADWARWMKAEAGNAEKALGKLMDACVEFDDRHGYGLVSKLASALKQQGFAPGAP
jgi:hypothetical protein